MTLSNLEIRNFGAYASFTGMGPVMGLLDYLSQNLENQSAIIYIESIHAIMMKYFWESMTLCH